MRAAVDEFDDAFAPSGGVERALDNRLDLGRHAFGDFAAQAFHVGEVAEDSAQADTGFGGDVFGAW